MEAWEWVDWEAQRGQYLTRLVCCATLKDAFKTLRGTWVEAWEWVDWEAHRGQYLTGLVCCATLKDAFWGHVWLPRTNP